MKEKGGIPKDWILDFPISSLFGIWRLGFGI
jgi:hypothetical protein